jgi:hypothetical protein
MVLMEVPATTYSIALCFSHLSSRLHSRWGEVQADIKQNALFSSCEMKQKKKAMVHLTIQVGERKGRSTVKLV